MSNSVKLIFFDHESPKNISIGQDELYKAIKSLADIQQAFDSFLNRIAEIQKTTVQQLRDQGYNANMQDNLLTITIPDAALRKVFLELLSSLSTPIISPESIKKPEQQAEDDSDASLPSPATYLKRLTLRLFPRRH